MRRTLVLLSLTTVVGVLAIALVTGSASADDTPCVGTLTPGTYDNVVVPPDASCTIEGLEILGNLKIEPNAGIVDVRDTLIVGNLQGEQFESLALHGSTVGGNVQVKKQADVEVCDNEIRGDLQVEEGSAGRVEIGYSGVDAPDCPGNTIQYGNIKVEKNVMTGQSWIEMNVVHRGNLQVFENRGPLNISGNQVPKGNLQCDKNSPRPTGGGNTAKKKEGQCRGL